MRRGRRAQAIADAVAWFKANGYLAMTQLTAETRPHDADSVETPSGKGRGDENFPVGSWLIRARSARRMSTPSTASPATPTTSPTIRRWRPRTSCAGSTAWRRSSTARRATIRRRRRRCARASPRPATTAQHCHDVLRAFRLDATKLRYRDWDDLMEYCRYSAAPVGRQLLDLHGESRDTWPASDALCAALQVLNHLQDCADDYRGLDRVYLPLADLARGRRRRSRR